MSKDQQIPEEIVVALEKMLKQRIQYVTLVSWFHEGATKLIKSHLVLGENQIHLVDDRFDKAFASISYSNITRVLVDSVHQEALQIHYSFDSDAFAALSQQISRNSVIHPKNLVDPVIVFAAARRTLICHLSQAWKTHFFSTTYQVRDLEVFQFDLLGYSNTSLLKQQQTLQKTKSTNQQSQVQTQINPKELLKSLQEPIPALSNVAALNGNDVWTLKRTNTYLIGNRVFQLDKSFERRKGSQGRFKHKTMPNLRISIETTQVLPHSYFREMKQSGFMKQYAESILDSVILPELQDHEEDDEYVIMRSCPYNKREHKELGKDYSKKEGWMMKIRTVFRDIYLIVMRESFLPPAAYYFQDYYVLLLGDFEGYNQNILLDQDIELDQSQLFTLATQIVDSSRISHHCRQNYSDELIQLSLNSLLFQRAEGYTYLSSVCKMVPQFLIFGVPYVCAIINNLKYKTSKEEKMFEEINKVQVKGELRQLLQNSKELIEQLGDKMSPFELIDKFLQRSMFVNNIETRLNWLQKLSFLMSYSLNGTIHPAMTLNKLFLQFFDDEEYFGRILSFCFFMKEKPSEPDVFKSQNRFGLYIPSSEVQATNLAYYTQFANPSTFKKQTDNSNSSKLSSQPQNLVFDLQNLCEEPDQFEYNEEVMLVLIKSLHLFNIAQQTNQPQIITKLYNHFLNPKFTKYPLQLATVESITNYLKSTSASETQMQIFKQLVQPLLQLCLSKDLHLIKISYIAIGTIVSKQSSSLLSQFELIKENGPYIIVDSLQIIDIEQINIIMRLISLLKNNLDVFIQHGLISKLLRIIQIFEEIEGLKISEDSLLELEDLIYLIVRKQERSQLNSPQKKILFGLLKSTISISPQHLQKVIEIIKEVIKKDSFMKKSMVFYFIDRLLNLIYTIDKKPLYEHIYCQCLSMIQNYVTDNQAVKQKLMRDMTLKGIIQIKRSQIPADQLQSARNKIETFYGVVIALWEELYDPNLNSANIIKKDIEENEEDPKMNKNQDDIEGSLDQENEQDEEEDSLDSLDSEYHKGDKELSRDEPISPLETEENQPKRQQSQKQRTQVEIEVLGKFHLI